MIDDKAGLDWTAGIAGSLPESGQSAIHPSFAFAGIAHDARKRSHSALCTTAPTSDLRSLGEQQCILDVHNEIADRVLYLGMTEQNLDRPDITGGPVDHCRLRPAH